MEGEGANQSVQLQSYVNKAELESKAGNSLVGHAVTLSKVVTASTSLSRGVLRLHMQLHGCSTVCTLCYATLLYPVLGLWIRTVDWYKVFVLVLVYVLVLGLVI